LENRIIDKEKMNKNLHESLVSALLNVDRPLANQLVDDWIDVNGVDGVMIEIVNPVLEIIGEKYQKRKDFSLAQAYVAGKFAEDILNKVASQQKTITDDIAPKRPVVIGNIEDDYHPLGRKLVGIFLRAKGWEVYDLGVDVTAEKFIEKALEVKAHVIGASAMIYSTAVNIKKLREEINRRGLARKLKLAVGGGVFKLRPELINEVGGDGTAESAVTAPEIFEDLWNESTKEG